MRIVVFGAGGFVGGWICEELAQRANVDLIACVRNWASAVRVARRGMEIQQAPLENLELVRAVLDKADVVINASMPAPAGEPDLVKSLYETAVKARVHRFVQLSSAAIYGDSTGEVDETVPPAPIDDYSRGKARMEQHLMAAATNSQLPVVILRPSIVYGPFSDAWTLRFVERVTLGRWLGLGPLGVGTCNLVHAHDLARAVVCAAMAELPNGAHVLNINGPDTVTWNDYIQRMGDALDIHGRSVPNTVAFRGLVTLAQLMRAGARAKTIKAFFRRSTGTARVAMKNAQALTKLYPSASELKLFRRRAHYVSSRAAHVIGFSPTISLQDGLRQSVAWCRTHGVV